MVSALQTPGRLPVVGTSHSGPVAPARQQVLKCLQSSELVVSEAAAGPPGQDQGNTGFPCAPSALGAAVTSYSH